jgi:Flp pilus assembly protein TadG
MLRERKRDSGQELVEFAIVFPLLMLLLLGIIDFGRIMYSYSAITNAAREGTRYAIVPDHQGDIAAVTESCDSWTNPIVGRVCDRAMALERAALQVTVSEPDVGTVQVQVVYTGQFLTNLVLQWVQQGGLQLQAAATMRLE